MKVIIFLCIVLVVPNTLAGNHCQTRSCIKCLEDEGCLFGIYFNGDGICATFEDMDNLQVSHIITHSELCEPAEVADREPLPIETKEDAEQNRETYREVAPKISNVPAIRLDAPTRGDPNELATSGTSPNRPTLYYEGVFTAKPHSETPNDADAAVQKTQNNSDPSTHRQKDNSTNYAKLNTHGHEKSGHSIQNASSMQNPFQTNSPRPPSNTLRTINNETESKTEGTKSPSTLTNNSTTISPLTLNPSTSQTKIPRINSSSPTPTTSHLVRTIHSTPSTVPTPSSLHAVHSNKTASPTNTSIPIKRKCPKETQLEKFRRSMCRNYELFKKLNKKNLVSEYSLWAFRNPMLYKTAICEGILKKRRVCKDMQT